MMRWLRAQNPWMFVLGAITFFGLISLGPLVARSYLFSYQMYSGTGTGVVSETGPQMHAEAATTALISWVAMPVVVVLTLGSALALLALAALRHRRTTAR